ncbi:MAG: helix-turn-helix domain-containing protein [Lachnospiraceae bacterium]|jgi:transcriptional regulator with XRE-family HTH domain
MRLKSLRVRDKISREYVARKLDISAGTIRNWELGKTEPSVVHIKALADLFGVTTDYLLEREEKTNG